MNKFINILTNILRTAQFHTFSLHVSRFRPLTREELENLIADNEKKNKIRTVSDSVTNTKNDKTSSSSATSTSQAGKEKDSKISNSNITSVNDVSLSPNEVMQLVKMKELADEILKLKSELTLKDGTFMTLKDEISRLRARNSKLCAIEEESDMTERRCKELKEDNERFYICYMHLIVGCTCLTFALSLYLSSFSISFFPLSLSLLPLPPPILRLQAEVTDLVSLLATSKEEVYQVRAAGDMSLEEVNIEAEGYKQQIEKGLRQNKSLLQRMVELERQLDKSVLTAPKNSADLASIEAERLKLEEAQMKLKGAEDTRLLLASEGGADGVETSAAMKILMREKNDTIREQKRTIAELSRQLKNTSAAATAGVGVQNIVEGRAVRSRKPSGKFYDSDFYT